MDRLAHLALPAIIITSALGAMAMCALVYLYGLGGVTDDEEPEERMHRLVRTRIGHAFAGICFAVAAILAVVAMATRVVPRATRITSAVPTTADAAATTTATVREIAALRDELRAGLTRLTTELSALEEQVAALPSPVVREPEPSASTRTAPTRREPAQAMQTVEPARPEPAPPRRVAITTPPAPRLVPRALPPRIAEDEKATGTPTSLVTTVQGVRIELDSVPVAGAARYTVRLTDPAGRPLRDADITLHGRMADGTTVQAALEPTTEPGVYRARIASGNGGPRDLRLRVAQRERRFEVALGQPAAW